MKNMTAKILIAVTFCVLVFGCKKNDNKGKFGLKLLDVNGTTFNDKGTIIFNFEINHPATETINDKLFIRRKFFTCPNSNSLDSVDVPEYISTADLPINYELKFEFNGKSGVFSRLCSNGAKTDSLFFTFWLKDKFGNLTDSVTSPKIILKKG
jgi:hypothetical protein